jgi:hypothetical protein
MIEKTLVEIIEQALKVDLVNKAQQAHKAHKVYQVTIKSYLKICIIDKVTLV